MKAGGRTVLEQFGIKRFTALKRVEREVTKLVKKHPAYDPNISVHYEIGLSMN